MKDFLLSISDEDIKTHFDYRRIIQPGESLNWNKRNNPEYKTGFGVVGENKRWYFIVNSCDLESDLTYLISGMNTSAEVKIQQLFENNLPKNLQEIYKKNLDNLLSKATLKARE